MVGDSRLHIAPGLIPFPSTRNFVLVLMHLMRGPWHGWPAWLSFLWSVNIYTHRDVYALCPEIFFWLTTSSYWDLCLPTCTAGKSKQQTLAGGGRGPFVSQLKDAQFKVKWLLAAVCTVFADSWGHDDTLFSSVAPLLCWSYKFLEEGTFVSICIMHLSESKQ